ncbi:ornithine carbamoyltransferase, putative, partial [Aduncisulcus paluster]
MSVRHLLKASDLTKEEFLHVLELGKEFKADPSKHSDALKQKTLLMLFAKPSLRTRVSFETGMTMLGGHAIYYSVKDSPLGKKETIEDTAKVLSRMVDVVMARLNLRKTMGDLAKHSTIPTINALDDFAHPCQMLADMMTIYEKRGSFDGLKMAFCGDCHNNVTYDLMRSAALLGFEMRVAGPEGEEFEPEKEVLEECAELCKVSGGKVIYTHDAVEAVKDCEFVYADSWMSYHISPEEEAERKTKFMPYQITRELLSHAA